MTDLLFASHTQRARCMPWSGTAACPRSWATFLPLPCGCGFSGGLASVRVLAAVLSSKIVAVGPNYRVHAAEQETWSPSFRPS